jgi:DNA polymerase-3 subunit delta
MLTTLTGENGFGLSQALRRVVDEFVAEHGDLGLVQLDGEETTYEQVREALESMPFLASRKLVVLRTPGAQKEFVERAQDLLTDVPEQIDVVIVEPKLDKRSSYYKWLKAHTDYQSFDQLDAGGLTRWLVSLAKHQGATLSSADARYLVERAGADQQLLGNELDKLISYSDTISRQSIDLLVEPAAQSTVFELLDALFEGNNQRAVRLYAEQRIMGVDPQQIIAMLGWQLHVLALVTAGRDKPDATIASEARISPYVVGKTRGLSRRLSGGQVRELVTQVLEIDAQSKRGAMDPDQALQNLFTIGV